MIVIHRGFETPLVFKGCGLPGESLKVFVNLSLVKKSAYFSCRNNEDCWTKNLWNNPVKSLRAAFVLFWLCGLIDFWEG